MNSRLTGLGEKLGVTKKINFGVPISLQAPLHVSLCEQKNPQDYGHVENCAFRKEIENMKPWENG
jgi:hypothetical protein